MRDRIDAGEPENIQRRDILPEDKLPPELARWRQVILWVGRTTMAVGIIYVICVCILIFWNPSAVPVCVCWSYLALAGFLSGLVTEFIIRHNRRVHEKRKEDRKRD